MYLSPNRKSRSLHHAFWLPPGVRSSWNRTGPEGLAGLQRGLEHRGRTKTDPHIGRIGPVDDGALEKRGQRSVWLGGIQERDRTVIQDGADGSPSGVRWSTAAVGLTARVISASVDGARTRAVPSTIRPYAPPGAAGHSSVTSGRAEAFLLVLRPAPTTNSPSSHRARTATTCGRPASLTDTRYASSPKSSTRSASAASATGTLTARSLPGD